MLTAFEYLRQKEDSAFIILRWYYAKTNLDLSKFIWKLASIMISFSDQLIAVNLSHVACIRGGHYYFFSVHELIRVITNNLDVFSPDVLGAGRIKEQTHYKEQDR